MLPQQSRAVRIMSDPESDSQDLLFFILYFILTCLAVFFLILTLFLCFSGRICFFIYYMVYNVQVQNRVNGLDTLILNNFAL